MGKLANLDISKKSLTFLIKNGFLNHDLEVINAFVDTYNKCFIDKIYNLTIPGEFGLQGFVNQEGVDIVDLYEIYREFIAKSSWDCYFTYNEDGFAVCLSGINNVVLDKKIDKLLSNEEAKAYFLVAVDFYDIMDTTNAHNPDLVKKINTLWVVGDKELWKNILWAIALRDKDEMEEKRMFVESRQDAYDIADLILAHVCDDGDLEMIINYIRI